MADDTSEPEAVVRLTSDIYGDGTVATTVDTPTGTAFSFTGSVDAAAAVNQEAVAEQINTYAALLDEAAAAGDGEAVEDGKDSADLEPETATPK